ncbi:hypothetical protein FB480_103100 [Agrobacterium vitis]|nr:hypothetical protein FB480_103100 [Agrobacterium vitis]
MARFIFDPHVFSHVFSQNHSLCVTSAQATNPLKLLSNYYLGLRYFLKVPR